jgi:hypothetical protein
MARSAGKTSNMKKHAGHKKGKGVPHMKQSLGSKDKNPKGGKDTRKMSKKK